MSWVNTRIPAAKAEPSHGAAGPASDTAAISALDRQLSADDQAVAVLARRAEAAKTAATTRPPVPGASLPTARPAASSGAAPSSGSSIVVPTLAPLPPLPSQPAPTTHATTGASHAG